MKTCARCGIEKADEYFWGRYCIPCRKIRAKEYRDQNKEIIREKAHLYYKANRESIKESQREYTKRNAEHHREMSKQYYKNNLEKVKEYRKANKDHLNKLGRESTKRRRAKINEYRRSLILTPRDKLNKNMRNGIWRSINREGKNGRSWKALVGYTIDELKQHLEKQFDGEMNWDNYGSYWHVDHIIPKSAFNYSAPDHLDFRRCWELKNLRPLIAIQNLRKGSKIDKPFQPSLLLDMSLYA
jgi:5-methylcytosine-specific restriction endonuclease McrA